ncbi:MAG: magnesium transporter CorA family protein [Acidimicrobiales bacterium]
MEIRALECARPDPAVVADIGVDPADDIKWRWIDIRVEPGDTAALVAFVARFELDPLAVRHAMSEGDLPKTEDFGESLLVILHGLAEDRVATYEVDCFLLERVLITIRRRHSPAIEALWTEVQERVELTSGGADELLARLANVLTRRLVAILDVFDARIEHLIELALQADGSLIREVTLVRRDLAAVRRAVQPQREVLDLLRVSTSPLITRSGQRRCSDVFDVASRVSTGIDAARTALTEALEAYRGAEAKKATEVSKVLTIYAAIMLPLSLIVGFFGMNFQNLPGTANDNGWLIVTIAMCALAALSLGVFVSLGWIRRPSGREAGVLVGRGLIEGARAPIELVNAALEISLSPIRKSSDEAPDQSSDTDDQGASTTTDDP